MSTSVVDIAIDTDTLKLLPTWTAICTFMAFPMLAQSQQRCPTACIKWPCFGGYEGRGVCVACLCRLTTWMPPRRGLPTVAIWWR